MKKVITTLLGLLLSTGLVFAAFDDVQFGSGSTIVLSIGGNNLEFTVSGGSLVENITVEGGSFAMSILSGSTITVTSANRSTFNSITGTGISSSFTCNTDSSVLAISSSITTNVTVTPTGTICTAASGGGSGGGGGGGGGGGSPAPTPTPTPAPAPAAPTPTPAPVPAPTTQAPVTPAPTVAKPSPVASLISPVFNKDLDFGARGEDVKRLQELLKQDKSIYPEGQVTSYFGGLTRAAIIKFQIKYGVIKNANDLGNGRLGPKTRAKLKEIFGSPTSQPAPTPAPTPIVPQSSSDSVQRSALQKQLDALKLQLDVLLKKAKGN